MKFRSTFLLLLVAGALFAYLFFFESHHKSSREAADAASQIVQVDRDKINSISIRNSEAKIELRKGDDSQWRLEAPVKDRADSAVIAQLFTSAETRAEETIPVKKKRKEELKEYGIADSSTKLKLSGDGKPVELIFGKDTAVAGKSYLYAENAGKIYVTSNELRAQISKKADDFRDRRLTDLTIQEITKMVIKSPAGELELARKNNHWSIEKPLQARGNDLKINDLAAQTMTARIDQFISDPNLAAYGLSEPRGSIVFSVEGSEKPVVLQIGAHPKEEKDKEKTYVKLSTRDGLELASKAADSALETKPDDLRDRNLLRLETDIVDRITIEAGSEKFTVGRKGESWVRKEGEQDVAINSSEILHLLSALQSAQVVDFVSDAAVDLGSYGLNQPAIKITFSSYASENTAESNKGEQPILEVLFGSSSDGNVFAKLDTEPAVLAVSKTLLEAIPTSRIQLQNPEIYHFRPEEISAVEVDGDGRPPVGLEREKSGEWKLVRGSGKLNEPAIQQFVIALSTLRASRWLGPAQPEYGLGSPMTTIRFTASIGGTKTPCVLTIGAAGPDGLRAASAEGLPGAFLLTRVDSDTFHGALTDAPAPKPEAAPSLAAPPTSTPSSPAPAEAAPAIPTTPDAALKLEPQSPAAPNPPVAPAAPQPNPESTPASPATPPAAGDHGPAPSALPAAKENAEALLSPSADLNPSPSPAPDSTPAAPRAEPAIPPPSPAPQPPDPATPAH